MVTLAENERLAVLEAQYKRLEADVAEIKHDVKELVRCQGELSTANASHLAAVRGEDHQKEVAGVWVRTFLPLVLALIAVALSFYNSLMIH